MHHDLLHLLKLQDLNQLKKKAMNLFLNGQLYMKNKKKVDFNNIWLYLLKSKIVKELFYLELEVFYKVFENVIENKVIRSFEIFCIIYWEPQKIFIQLFQTFIKVIHCHIQLISLNLMNNDFYKNYEASLSNQDLLMIIYFQLKIF